jgi:coenzyme F420-0:L-glutamate ligase/coenzyme F420-1:gamma-L-glutamate ligase
MQAIINESNKIISTEKNVVIVEHKLGFININAGIDQSNILQDKNLALLLPENPSKSAKDIQKKLSEIFNKNISIIISDSMTRPYRSGIINFALSSNNIQSLIDLKGEKDMFGNKLRGTEIAVADELASAAGLLMGQSDEGKPVIIIKGFNKAGYKVNDAIDLIVDESEDLYR